MAKEGTASGPEPATANQEEPNGTTGDSGGLTKTDGNDAGVASVAGVQNTTDESSELSDLGDDSEAETDQMDFLEDGDLNKKLDLRALSDLTEMARLQGVDSDEESLPVKPEEPLGPMDEALALNPKDNEEASREIMKDIDAIHEELGRPLTDEAGKRKVSDDERPRKKHKPPVKNEDGENVEEKEEERVEENAGENAETAKEALVDVRPKDEPPEETAEEAEAEDDAGDEEEADEPRAQANSDNEENEENEDEDEDNHSFEDGDMSEKRQAAVAELIEIEKAFASLRDKMYHDKLNLLEHELQLCVEGSHPELSKIYYKINAFHQDALRQANSNLSYRLKCIDRETIACRTAVHQNFLKQVYDSKSDMITNTTSMWYKINRERNQLDQLVPDYSYSAVGGAGVSEEDGGSGVPQSVLYELVSQRNSINCQLGILNGLVEFSGIPAAVGSSLGDDQPAPELLLRKASDEEIADDLRAMGVS